jgi:acetyltransferase
VLAENTVMLEMCRNLGFEVKSDAEDPALCHVTLQIRDP